MVKGMGERAVRGEQGGELLCCKVKSTQHPKKKILGGSEAWVLETI